MSLKFSKIFIFFCLLVIVAISTVSWGATPAGAVGVEVKHYTYWCRDGEKNNCRVCSGVAHCSETETACKRERFLWGGQSNPKDYKCTLLTTTKHVDDINLLKDDIEEDVQCFSWGSLNLWACAENLTAIATVGSVEFFSLFLKLAGKIFDASINFSIISFQKYAGSSAITSFWSLGRDLANIFFIFILMYIAIATIIQKAGIQTKDLIVKLIITALLINFSIIIPRVIIDVGNSLSVVFYNNITIDSSGKERTLASILVRNHYKDTILKPDKGPRKGIGGILVSALKTITLMLVLTYVLLVISYFFLARAVTLLILIATSSLVFFSRIIPDSLGLNMWDKWLKTLIKETIFAPVFLFLLYLVLKIATQPTILINEEKEGIVSQLFNFVILIGLSFASLIIARKIGAESGKLGGNFVNKAVSKGSKSAGKMVAGNTVGRGANYLANSETVKDFAAKSTLFGGTARRGLQSVANQKFGGKQGFVDSNKARADKMKEDMKGMTNEQKATYMKNLSSGKWSNAGIDSRSVLYQHGLSEEERTKIEGGVASTNEAGATEAGKAARAKYETSHSGANSAQLDKVEKDAKEAHIATATEFITNQRKNLKGEEKTKTYTKRINGEKDGNKKLKLLMELTDEKERKAVIKELDNQALAKITTSTDFATVDPNIKKNIDDRIGGLDAEASEKVEKEKKAEKAKEETQKRKSTIEKINSEAKMAFLTTLKEGEIKKLSTNDIKSLEKITINRIANDPDLLNQMKPEALIALYKNKDLSDQDALLGRYQTLATGPGASNAMKVIGNSPASVLFNSK